MDDPDCGGSEMPVECEFSMWFQETIDMNEYGGCEEYVRGSNAMPEDVTEEQICDTSGGVPALAYGITMTIFPDRTGIMKLPVAERKARLRNSTRKDIPCTTEVLLNGIKGADYQDCLNRWVLEKGEVALENAACEYFSTGAASSCAPSRGSTLTLSEPHHSHLCAAVQSASPKLSRVSRAL